MKTFICVILPVISVIFAGLIFPIFSKTGERHERPFKNENDTVSVIGVGDIMPGSNFPSPGVFPPNDGKDIFKNTKHLLEDADLTVGNLEGVIMSADAPSKKNTDSAYNYSFKMNDYYAAYLKEAGFDIMNIANNHIGDFGVQGIKNTTKILEKYGLKYAGLKDVPFTIIERKNLKIGFCAFAPNSVCNSFHDLKQAIKLIKYLDSVCNIVIVSMHIGAEGSGRRHITFNEELFLGEKRGNPYAFARAAIDAGADIILGHGPHVVRAVDLYKKRFIAYSLGNFFTFGRFNIKGYGGRAPILKIFINSKGEFIKAGIFSTRQKKDGSLLIDKENGALKDIIGLTKSDFPDSGLIIGNDGTITLRP
jgi:hypothetical protein